MDQQWLEALLKKEDYDKSVLKVLKVEKEALGKKGENYLSQIAKLKITVLLGSGKKSVVELIMKTSPEGSTAKAHVKEWGVFKQEVTMYTTILKEMDNLMIEFGDKKDKLWCDLIGYEPYETIVFRDLTAEGFVVTDRTKGQDLEHSLIVVESLARFHAMSKVLLQRGIVSPKDLKPYLVSNPYEFNKIWGVLIPSVGKEIQKWGKEWEAIGEKVIKIQNGLDERIQAAYDVDENRFNVINHGDSWTCNLMFKYSSTTSKKPVSLRFVDFQMSYYNSAAWDLTYFMATSLRPPVRREIQQTLLDKYIEVLNESLEFYKCEGPRLNMPDLQAEMKRLDVFKFLLLITTHPIMTSELKDAYDFDRINEESPINLELYRGERGAALRSAIGPDLHYFVESGLLE